VYRDRSSTRRQLGRTRAAFAALLAATGGLLALGMSQPAKATLSGSSFDATDASPVGDLAAGAVDLPDDFGNTDATNFSNGSTEDTICPGVSTGTAPNSTDFDHFYFGTESNASGVFVYLAWHRIDTHGTKTLDFELNQSRDFAPGCTNGYTPARTANDVLLSYDFSGGGGTVTLTQRLWVGTASAGSWGAPTALVTGQEASVDTTGAFGEMVVNGTATGLMAPGVCTNFASGIAKSHASNSFGSELKDFTPRYTRNVSNCGSVDITKTDDASPAQPLNGAVFGLYTDNAGTIGTAIPSKTCTTAGSGTCTIANITPAGTYWVSETTTPTGYTTAADQQVTVTLGHTSTLNFTDNRQPASIVITKTDDAVPAQAVNGAIFGLFTDNAGVIGSAVSGKTCTTAAGTCTIANILPAGTYWVSETTTPAGYTTAANQKVTLALNQVARLTFVDRRIASAIAVAKSVNGLHPTAAVPLVVEAGAPLSYVVTVTNTGGLDLTVDQLADSLRSNLVASCTQGIASTLAPTAAFTCTYSEVAGQNTHNVVDVAATDRFARTRSASDETFVTVIHPAIALAKSGPAIAHVGDSVVYDLALTNPGDIGLTGVVVSDAKCASTPVLQSKSGANSDAVLDPAETWMYNCTHVVTASDGTSILNTAGATGTDPLGRSVSSTSSHSTVVLHPGITINKTADPRIVDLSNVVTYTYTVRNTGDAPLHDVTLDDDVLGRIDVPGTLGVGASVTATKSMPVTVTSPKTNVATVRGTDAGGAVVEASAKATIALVLGEVIAVAPSDVLRAPELPRTGAPIMDESRIALVLIGFGALLVLFGRRRGRGAASS